MLQLTVVVLAVPGPASMTVHRPGCSRTAGASPKCFLIFCCSTVGALIVGKDVARGFPLASWNSQPRSGWTGRNRKPSTAHPWTCCRERRSESPCRKPSPPFGFRTSCTWGARCPQPPPCPDSPWDLPSKRGSFPSLQGCFVSPTSALFGASTLGCFVSTPLCHPTALKFVGLCRQEGATGHHTALAIVGHPNGRCRFVL